MTHVLVLGANGQLARHATQMFLSRADVHLTLYLRNAGRLKKPDPARTTVAEGDVLDVEGLKDAMKAHDEAIDYRLSQKGEPFRGYDVSLNRLSDLIVRLALSPTLHVRSSLGVAR
jgi:uncharacterized protein YbjT (DUF2867 family)